METNDYQVGGTHYKKFKYEHWDWVVDTGQHYLIGCATKYASRWRDKGGELDLRKISHYLAKAMDYGIYFPSHKRNDKYNEMFLAQVNPNDLDLLCCIINNEFDRVDTIISDTIMRLPLSTEFIKG